MEDRIVDLETQLAYQSREIAELNAVVIELRGRVEHQQKQIEIITQTLRAVAPSEVKPLSEESPPPHY